MSDVPSNLIPTRITQLPIAPVADENSLMMIVYQGNNYQIRVGDLLSVAGVPTSTQVIAGTGLAGGGQLTGNVTLSVAVGGIGNTQLADTGVTSGTYGNATNIPVFTVDAKGRIQAATTVPASGGGGVPTTTEVIAGTGLNGGGQLTGNVTLNANLSNALPLVTDGLGSAGVSNNIARADHQHPSVNLQDSDEVDGVLSVANGGTSRSLVPSAGAIIWSGADGLYVGPVGVAGQVLVSDGANEYNWADQQALDVGQADNINGGVSNQVLYQTSTGTTGFVPAPTSANTILYWNGTALVWGSVPGTGTVTSVGLALPADFAVSGSPVTGSGTLTGAWLAQPANRILSGPTTGADATPTFRTLTNQDIPSSLSGKTIAGSTITTSTINSTTIGATTPSSGVFTTVDATDVTASLVDATNLEVMNLKAKDGTAAGSIADTTGVVTLNSAVLTTADINGGTVDGTIIGGSSAAAITGTTITANTQFNGAGTGLTGTASSLSIGGNAATATTATTATSATTATTATNIAGGAAGSVPYQTGSGATALLAAGTGVLVGGSTPSYSTTPALTGTNFTGIPNGALTNSAVTVGTTSISLGATSLTLGGLTSVAVTQDPVSNFQVATKQYVDSLVTQGISYHEPVFVESPNTAGNLNATYNNGASGVGATLTNAGTQVALTIDGILMTVGKRVLIYNQTAQAENGVYTVTTVGDGSTNWVLTRATDANTYGLRDPNALGYNDAFFVTNGNTGAGETYVCTTSGVITFGTTAITFAQISSAQVYSAGTGLTLTGTQFSVTNTAVTAGSYGSGSQVGTFAVNAQGQLTSASNVAIAIANTQVSGLGTMSTQNANSVAVTGGAIDGTTIGATTATTVKATTVTTTGTGSPTDGAGQVYLNGSTSNRVEWNTQGTGAPAFTTRSAGTKLLLYPTLSGSVADYAIGIDAATMWSSVPENNSGFKFKWYGATTEVASLDGAGAFTATGGISGGTF